MTDQGADGVVPIDRAVRSVVDEFARDPLAMAAEIVRLRSELDQARLDASGPPPQIILRTPPAPPGMRPPPQA